MFRGVEAPCPTSRVHREPSRESTCCPHRCFFREPASPFGRARIPDSEEAADLLETRRERDRATIWRHRCLRHCHGAYLTRSALAPNRPSGPCPKASAQIILTRE